MLVRVRFAKYGVIKFIGHLDVMRYFQKLIRRSEIDVVYTQGFNPHQIMSFASPLGVGVTSDGEYMDIELLQYDSPEIMLARLQAAATEGFSILGVRLIGEREPEKRQENCMALVTAADYMLSLKDGYENELEGISFERDFAAFIQSSSINIIKKTKTCERELDLKPYIYKNALEYNEFYAGENSDRADRANIRHAESYENGFRLYLRLAAGSVMNIKPELVMEAFYQRLGREFNRYAWQVHRMELYKGMKEKSELEVL